MSRWLLPILCGLFAAVQSPAADRPPNVVFILADDLGVAEVGCYGQTIIRTPNVDRMAAGGMKFTVWYMSAVKDLLNKKTSRGLYPFAGLKHWEVLDNWGEGVNWGLISFYDNAYNGKDAVISRGTDQWGFPSGGEERNYGDYVTPVTQANVGVDAFLATGAPIPTPIVGPKSELTPPDAAATPPDAAAPALAAMAPPSVAAVTPSAAAPTQSATVAAPRAAALTRMTAAATPSVAAATPSAAVATPPAAAPIRG